MTDARTDTADERLLLAAARAGDPRAFGDLVDRHRPGLERFCCLMLGGGLEAEGLVSETIVRAWCERAECQGSARSWLYRIALRACLEEIEPFR